MKICAVIVVMLAFVTEVLAQPAKVTSNSVRVDGYTVDLPQILLATPDASQRANYHMEALILGEIVPTTSLNALIAASTASEGKSGLTSLSWKIVRNDGLLLSLYFRGEAMGAYPSSFERSITFDAATGVPITGHDLFTPAGYDRVLSLIIRERKHMVDLDTVGYSSDTSSDLQKYDISMMYDCADNSTLDPILVTDSTISPTEMRCLPHVAQALDINWSLPLPISTIKSNLSEYGRAVLIQKRPHAFIPSDSNTIQIYHGTIGTLPITMMIERTDHPEFGGLNVHYFYDNKSTTLEMGGGLTGNNFEVESYKAGVIDEKFVGTRRAGSIKGVWRKGKRRLPFELHPY